MAGKKEPRPEKILVVDDDAAILRLMEIALQNEGYQIITARNGIEALAKVLSARPNLIILDVMMPDMSGIQVCQALRSKPETATVPIILLSALAQVSDKVAGLRAGADEYVTKPVDLTELAVRVEMLIERTQRLSQVQAVRQGRMFAFLGVKGGVGTTTVALNVAALLAKQGKSVIYLELHNTYSTCSAQLKVAPNENLSHLLPLEAGRLGERELQDRLYASTNGLRILFGPQRATEGGDLDPDHAEAIVVAATRLAEYVIIDLPSAVFEYTRAVALRSDLVLLTLEPETSAVASAKVALDRLRRWNIGSGRILAVVANRCSGTAPISLRDITTQLGCNVLGIVPYAGEAQNAAMAQGLPLVIAKPDHIAVTALTEMVARLVAPSPSGIRL